MGGGWRLNYGELHAEVEACAAGLIAAGVGRGDRVCALTTPDPDYWVTFLATAAIGGIWVGLNPRYAPPELDAVLARVTPRLVFARDEIEGRSYRAWLASISPGTVGVTLGPDVDAPPAVSYRRFLAAGLSTPADVRDGRYDETCAADPCLIVFTSGSTGAPKGVMISQAALVGASETQLAAWPVDPLRVLNNLPINHIGCVGDLSCYALIGGGGLVFSPRFRPADSLALIRDEAVTVWGQVPTMFQLTLDAPEFDAARLRSLRLIFWGGAQASPDLVARLSALGARVATSYGQTETVGSVTFTAPGASLERLTATVGRAVPPYALRIVTGGGDLAAADEPGEVEVRTPFGMSGYWPGDTDAPRPDDWRPTGDVGILSAEGDLRLVGRVHDVFKSGGYNLHPAEIEAAMNLHPAVRETSVIGHPDPLYGAVPVAFVVAAAPVAEAELRAYLRDHLANYKIPKRVVFVDDLPRLAIGKIDKPALRNLAETRGL